MNEIKITNNNGNLTVSSVQVAENFGKDHRHVTRDIENLTAQNWAVKNLFIESTYINERGREYKSYEITRDGFSLLVMGFTGKAALEWKLKYIEAFNAMEQKLKSGAAPDKAKALEVKEMNAKVRMSNMFLKLSNVDTLSEQYKNILVAKAAEVLSGEPIIALPKSEQKMYSATEIGKMFGVSAQKIGSLSNKYGLKTEEFGEWYRDKSPYSSKEVDSFRYNDNAVAKFREILGA